MRILDEEKKLQIKNFYKPGISQLFFILFFGIFAITGIIQAFVFLSWIYAMIIFSISVIIVYFYISRIKKKVQNAFWVYENGSEVDIVFENITSNYSYRVNNMPQKIITIRIKQTDELINIKTFNHKLINAFSIPTQKAYTDPSYPNILIPESVFSGIMNNSNAKKVKRSISM